MIKEAESHEARSHWTLMKKSEVNNKYKNKDGKLDSIYPFGISSTIDYHIDY